MPQNPYDELDALLRPIKEERKAHPVYRVIADTTRAIGERAVPLAALTARLGSGVASATGGWPGALMSGGGEVLAQMIEQGHWDPRDIEHKARVGAEAGIGAIPFVKTLSAGKTLASTLKSLAKGGAVSTAGTVGRKAADSLTEGSIEPLKEWGPWDALPTVLGAGASAVIGRKMAVDQPLPELGSPRLIPRDGLRLATQQADAPAGIVKESMQKARAATTPGTLRLDDREALSDVDRAIAAAGEIGASQRTVNEKFGKVAATHERARRNAKAVSQRVAELEGTGASASTSVSSTSKMQTPSGDVSARTVIRKAGKGGEIAKLPNRITPDERNGLAAMTPERASQMLNRDPEAMTKMGELLKEGENYRINPNFGKQSRARTPVGGKLPERPVAPKPGVFQVVTPEGKIVEATSEDDVNAVLLQFGPKSQVVLPKDYAPPTVKGLDAPAAAPLKSPAAAQPAEDLKVTVPDDVAPTLRAPAAPIVEQPSGLRPGAPPSVQLRLKDLGYDDAEIMDMVSKRSAQDINDLIMAGMKKSMSGRTPASVAPIVAATPKASVAEAWSQAPDRASADVAVDQVFKSAFPEEFYRVHAPLSAAYNRALDLTASAGTAAEKTAAKAARTRAIADMDAAVAQAVASGQVRQEAVEKAIQQVRQIRSGSRKGASAVASKTGTVAPAAAAPSLDAPAASPPTVKAAAPIIDTPASPREDFYAIPTGSGLHNPQARLDFLTQEKARILQNIDETAPDALKIQMKAAEDNLILLERAGKVPSKEATQISQKLEKLRQASFEQQHPRLVAELADAEGAVKAFPKGKGSKASPKISANPVFDPEAYRWAVQSLGPEGMGALAGAGVGALSSEEDPLGGAVVGGLAGGLGGRALKSLQGAPIGDDAKQGLSAWDRLINWERFSLLANPNNLPINFAAPTTGSALSAIERMVAGAAAKAGARGNPDDVGLGWEGLKNVINPRRIADIPSDVRAAHKLISEAERADLAHGGASPTLFDKVLRIPADVLTTGDIGARNALMKAGWTEEMARLATVTSNPRYEWLGQAIDNAAKQGIFRFLVPFRRTAANVLEGSLERVPILGPLMQLTQTDPALRASMAELVAQQGVGSAVTALSYMLGANIDPDTARDARWPLMITNLTGQYGALAGAAFAMGQRSQYDDSLGSQARAGINSLTRDLPLPTTQPITDVGNAGAAYLDGEPPNPNAEYLPQRWLPNMLTPRFLRDEPLAEILGDDLDNLLRP